MISLDLAQCSGCRRCEVNCSFFHTGRIGRSQARIKVVKLENIGIDYPVVCQQCAQRYCTKCPQKAIAVGPQGQVLINSDLCDGCGTCATLCPIGAIELQDETPLVCDLCRGEPSCVAACTMEAIHFDEHTTAVVDLKPFKKGSRGLDPEAKRVVFATTRSQALREQWAQAHVDRAGSQTMEGGR